MLIQIDLVGEELLPVNNGFIDPLYGLAELCDGKPCGTWEKENFMNTGWENQNVGLHMSGEFFYQAVIEQAGSAKGGRPIGEDVKERAVGEGRER